MIQPETLKQEILEHSISLVSFDIFDTLICRPFADPTKVFSIMRQHNPLIPMEFPEQRVIAEQEARQHCKGGECNIEEIYAVLAQKHGFTEELCRILCPMEKETELRFCQSRPEGAALLEMAASLDVRVILISDMYLSRQRISRILCKCGIKNFEELYISSEERRSKATGELYRYVQKKEELPFSVMLHIGDNPISDVIIPQNLGMRAIYLPLAEGTPMPQQKGILQRLFPYGSRRRNTAAKLVQILKETNQ